jgi:GTPase involved in cell partitioning and DNA repair
VKKILAYSSMFFVAMMVALSVSAAGIDFSGTWKLDPAKSTMPQGPGGGGGGGGDVTMKVTQDAKTLTSTRTTARGEQVTTYNLDGSESSSESPRGKSKHKVKWQSDGKILEINTVTNANFQGNEMTINTVSHWELMDGGKTLKIHSKTTTPQGDRESTQIFAKQ